MKPAALDAEQPQWHAPKLQELGNLRDFVRTGTLNGKSGSVPDGMAMCAGEAKVGSGDCAGS